MLFLMKCFGGKKPGFTWRESWRALEAAYKAGHVRAIGVSNFNLGQMKELLTISSVKPHVLQSWMDPFQQARDLRSLCLQEKIHFTAYDEHPTDIFIGFCFDFHQ